MKNQLKKEVRAVLIASLTIASEKIEGFSIGVKKNKILVDFSGPGKVPVIMTILQPLPDLIVVEVVVNGDVSGSYIPTMKLDPNIKPPYEDVGNIVIHLLENFISVESDVQSGKTKDTGILSKIPVAQVKRITQAVHSEVKEVVDITVSCNNEEPFTITVPKDLADSFKEGELVIHENNKLSLYNRGKYLQ
jgi:hypothetical protein